METPAHWRLRFLDGLRGVAITQVVMSTYLAAFHPLTQPVPLFQDSSLANTFLAMISDGYSGICMFLAVSGFALTRTYDGSHAPVGRLLAGRAVRLALPALAAVLLGAAVAGLLPGVPRAAAAWTGSPLLAALFPIDPAPEPLVRDAAVAFFLGYNGSSAAADLLTAYHHWLLPHAGRLNFPLMDSFNPALWSLCLQTSGSLVVIVLIAARRAGIRLWLVLVTAAGTCLAMTPLAALLAGHVLARLRSSTEASLPAAVAWPGLLLGTWLCLGPFPELPAAFARFCAGPGPDLTACGDPGHLTKIAGTVLIFLTCTICPPLQRLLARFPLTFLGRLSLPIYLSHVPAIGGICSAALLAFRLPAGAERSLLVALVAITAVTIFTALLRPLDILTSKAGHAIAFPRHPLRETKAPRLRRPNPGNR